MPRLQCKISVALKDFDLRFDFDHEVNNILGVFGPSGSGKTTLLRVIAGHHKTEKSRVVFDETPWQDDNKTFLAPHKRNIGYLSQAPYLFEHLNSRDNFLFGIKKTVSNDDIKHIEHLLDLTPLFSRKTSQLSGGEKQRLALGRAALTKPQMWLMDEPLSALDGKSKIEMISAIKQIHALNKAPVLYVSHSWDEICRLAEGVILIEKGQTSIQGLSHKTPSSHRINIGNILKARFVSFEKEYSIARYGVGDASLYISTQKPDRNILIYFRSEDVSIHLKEPLESSISNFLPGKITKIVDLTCGEVLIEMEGNGYEFNAKITQKSMVNLELKLGKFVYGGIKTISLA